MHHRSSALALVCILLGGCASAAGGAADSVATTTATRTLATTTTSSSVLPTTTVRATTTTTAATTTTTTMPVTTTTTEPLPVPLPAPAPTAKEPLVQLGTLEMPSLGVLRPLMEGVSLTVLNTGPGHWPGTALPGHIGNVVIGGHRTSHDKPFRHIDQLAPGDEVVLTTDEGRFVYKVTSTEVVTPDAIWIIDQTEAFTATLFACHPVGSTRERLIVHLELSDQ